MESLHVIRGHPHHASGGFLSQQYGKVTRAPGSGNQRAVLRVLRASIATPPESPPASTSVVTESRSRATCKSGSRVRTPSAPSDPTLQKMVEELNTMGLKDTDLRSTPAHRAWVASACIALSGLAGMGLFQVSDPFGALSCAGSALTAYVLADMGTGFYHFGVDNYGSKDTPVFGSQIDAFQGHHRRPWTITKREFANNLQALAKPVLATTIALVVLPLSPEQQVFGAVFLACVMFSQQFHAWSHTPKKLLPAPVVALQDAGLVISRKMHGAHHSPPFDRNYCIVSGLCNGPLDQLGVFPALEKFIYLRLGVPSRSWSNNEPEWIAEHSVSYYEDGSEVAE